MKRHTMNLFTRGRWAAMGLIALTLVTPGIAQDTQNDGVTRAAVTTDRNDGMDYSWLGLIGLVGLGGLLKKSDHHQPVREPAAVSNFNR